MAAILISQHQDGSVKASKLVGADWDRGPHPEKRLPEATIRKLRANLAGQLGTQKKYNAVRAARTAIRKNYEYSSSRPKNSGYRFLTDLELDQWMTRVNAARQAKLGAAAKMKGVK